MSTVLWMTVGLALGIGILMHWKLTRPIFDLSPARSSAPAQPLGTPTPVRREWAVAGPAAERETGPLAQPTRAISTGITPTYAVTYAVTYAASGVHLPLEITPNSATQADDASVEDDPASDRPAKLPPWQASVFGVEAVDVRPGGETMANIGVSWVRRNGLVWQDIEPLEGMRAWRAAANLEQEMIQASALKLKFVLIIRGTPAWAQQVPNSFCGPIKPAALRAFSWFVRDVVARYSAPPFNVQYFELGNEPDAPIRNDAEVYGCWGDASQRYRGGTAYAAMLKVVYPQIKLASPQAEVLIGGLLANCDPVKPPLGTDCSWTRFFEGILEAGGGAYFDGLSFHTYEYYYKTPGRWGNANWNSYYNTMGPVLIAKARYYKSLLSDYNIQGKFLMDTEVALICWDCTPAHEYETAKAWYLAEVYAASMAEGLQATFWYSYNGWLGSGLVDAAEAPLPALVSLKVARGKFGGATFLGRTRPADVGGVEGIMGYKFRAGNRTIWLVRSADSHTREVVFDRLPATISDPFGTELTPSRRLTLTLKPMYIEWKD